MPAAKNKAPVAQKNKSPKKRIQSPTSLTYFRLQVWRAGLPSICYLGSLIFLRYAVSHSAPPRISGAAHLASVFAARDRVGIQHSLELGTHYPLVISPARPPALAGMWVQSRPDAGPCPSSNPGK